MNPYLVLNVPRDADDARIRRTYLEAIRVATPETAPERFKALTAAYQQIKDEASRLRHELFHFEASGHSPLEVFLRHARLAARTAPPSFEALKSFLQHCSRS